LTRTNFLRCILFISWALISFNMDSILQLHLYSLASKSCFVLLVPSRHWMPCLATCSDVAESSQRVMTFANTGRSLVKTPSSVRELSTLYPSAVPCARVKSSTRSMRCQSLVLVAAVIPVKAPKVLRFLRRGACARRSN
jgi:hypothetical protein